MAQFDNSYNIIQCIPILIGIIPFGYVFLCDALNLCVYNPFFAITSLLNTKSTSNLIFSFLYFLTDFGIYTYLFGEIYSLALGYIKLSYRYLNPNENGMFIKPRKGSKRTFVQQILLNTALYLASTIFLVMFYIFYTVVINDNGLALGITIAFITIAICLLFFFIFLITFTFSKNKNQAKEESSSETQPSDPSRRNRGVSPDTPLSFEFFFFC